MPDILVQFEQHRQRIEALIPPGEPTKDYLAYTLDTYLASLATDTPMGIVPASTLSTTRLYASARVAVELFDQPEQLAAKPEGIVDLGLIEWLLRPALPLLGGCFDSVVSGPWKDLTSNVIEQIAHSVCRLDLLVEGAVPQHIGTGFLVGEDDIGRQMVMTNAHVVEAAVDIGWLSIEGLSFACDFACEPSTAGDIHFLLANDYRLHPVYDLALVYLSPENDSADQPLPSSLRIAATVPELVVGLHIGVLGHPSFNSNLDPFPTYFGFGAEFGIKRFSPGIIRAQDYQSWREQRVEVFLHDATTLSGSSGSCIVDLGTGQVVGLHFGGWPKHRRMVRLEGKEVLAQLFLANGAVPLWTLKNDSLLNGVSFQ